MTTLTEKKGAQKEILEAITNSKILAAERVGSDSDGIKFKLTGDLNNIVKFTDDMKSTEFYTAVSDCVQSLGSDADTYLDTDDIDLSQLDQLRDQLTVEVYFWVRAWGHKPTRLSVDVKASEPSASLSVSATYKYNKPKVTIPNNSTSLMTVIQELMGSSYGDDTIVYDDEYYNDYYQSL
jgi:hypothetical protein